MRLQPEAMGGLSASGPQLEDRAPGSAGRGKKLRCPDELAELKAKRGSVHLVNSARGDDRPALSRQIETVTGIFDQRHAPPEIRSRADRRGNAHVRGNAEDNHVLSPEAAQAQIQIRADEGRIDALHHQLLAVLRLKAGAEAVAGLPGPERRAGLGRIMPHVDDGQAQLAPQTQQRQPVAVDIRVPARRPGRPVEGGLHVDRQQHGPFVEWQHGPGVSVRNLRSVAASIARSAAGCTPARRRI